MGLSRRALIKTAAAAGITASADAAATADRFSSRSGDGYDVIIVGAGFAGATAARELGKAGLRVLVIEARPRLGGRTFTSKFAGHKVEYGGSWIHWLQPHIWAEVTRYQLPIAESPTYALDRMVLIDRKGQRHEGDVGEMGAVFVQGFEKLCHDARKLFPRPFSPLWNRQALAADQESVQDRLNTLLEGQQRDMLDGVLYALTGSTHDRASATMLLRDYAAGGWNIGSFFDTLSHYKFKDGTISCIRAMLDDSGAEVVVGTPVSRIEHGANQVVVTTAYGGTIGARACVVTVPVNTYKNIEFAPELSVPKRAVLDAGQTSRGVKFYTRVRENLGRVNCMAPKEPVCWLQTEYYGNDGTLLIGYGRYQGVLDMTDSEAVAAGIRKFLPEATVLESASYPWNADPFSLGAWPAYAPGQMQGFHEDLARPEGRLFFAGSITAGGWYQFMDGAVESGLRVGREVLSAIMS